MTQDQLYRRVEEALQAQKDYESAQRATKELHERLQAASRREEEAGTLMASRVHEIHKALGSAVQAVVHHGRTFLFDGLSERFMHLRPVVVANTSIWSEHTMEQLRPVTKARNF